MATGNKRAGFTLVEMLVVVSIIGVLVALLLPAINMARGAAQRTQCINNQKNLGAAIIAYEGSKGRLPGVLNRVNPVDINSLKTTWVIALFGDLGRNDLADQWRDGVTGTVQPQLVDLLICPSNKQTIQGGGLSYMVNMGAYNPVGAGPFNYTGRLFRDRATATGTAPNSEPDFAITSLKSSAQTVMLSESLTAGPWNFIPTAAFAPSVPNPALLTKLAFVWPGNQPALPSPMPSLNTELGTSAAAPGLSSYHSGRIVVTFFDGHVDTLPESTFCWNDPDHPIYGTP